MRGPHERYRTGPEVWVVGRSSRGLYTSEFSVPAIRPARTWYGKPNFQRNQQKRLFNLHSTERPDAV